MFYDISRETHPIQGLWPLRSALINHGCRFRCMNGALCSTRFHRTGVVDISGCWSTVRSKVLMKGVGFAVQ